MWNSYVERMAIREQEDQVAIGSIETLELGVAVDPQMERLL